MRCAYALFNTFFRFFIINLLGGSSGISGSYILSVFSIFLSFELYFKAFCPLHNVMKHFINFNNSSFSISNSIVKVIGDKKKTLFKKEVQNKRTVLILNDSNISVFQTIPTDSSTHFYVLISDKPRRVTKQFYKFLSNYIKVEVNLNGKKENESLDKFYTKLEVSKSCVDVFTSNVKIKKQDLIIEPSAGDGNFIKSLKKINCNKIFLDIKPEGKQIKQANFLEWWPPEISGRIHVIGNPPFGKQSSLCLKFIKHASKFANSVSFILPLSFKKQSLISKMPKSFHLVKELIIEKNAFTYDGRNFNLPTVFQIWQRQEKLRADPLKESAKGFSFVDQSQANIAITRVGAHAGKIWLNSETNLLELSKTTHFFIKSDENLVNLLKPGKQIKCESVNWVVGPKSLAKTELISILNKIQKPVLFIKIHYNNGKAITPFLASAPMDGECSTHYFNSFICDFNDFCFDNISKHTLERLFKDGRYISPFLEYWLDQNTNLIYILTINMILLMIIISGIS